MNIAAIKRVEIFYENCEVYTIDAQFIKELYAKEPKIKYDLNNFPQKRIIEVTEFGLTIIKEADTPGSMWMEETRNPFERTLYLKDIVYIEVHFLNGSIKKIMAPWEGDSYYDNPNQSAEINNEGNLIIHVKKT